MIKTKMKKMNSFVKNAWIKALRSGKYKQTTGDLKNDYGYCCLGVLTDIYCKTHKQNMDDFSNYASLPNHITNDYKISRDVQEKLIEFNDDDKLSFNWIASYIERYL